MDHDRGMKIVAQRLGDAQSLTAWGYFQTRL
jgi:hypothetical protein